MKSNNTAKIEIGSGLVDNILLTVANFFNTG